MLLHEVSGFKAGVAKNVCDVSRRDVTAEKFKSELNLLLFIVCICMVSVEVSWFNRRFKI